MNDNFDGFAKSSPFVTPAKAGIHFRAVIPAKAGIQKMRILLDPGFRPDPYPHLTPEVFMEFVFLTTKDTKRTKEPASCVSNSQGFRRGDGNLCLNSRDKNE